MSTYLSQDFTQWRIRHGFWRLQKLNLCTLCVQRCFFRRVNEYLIMWFKISHLFLHQSAPSKLCPPNEEMSTSKKRTIKSLNKTYFQFQPKGKLPLVSSLRYHLHLGLNFDCRVSRTCHSGIKGTKFLNCRRKIKHGFKLHL